MNQHFSSVVCKSFWFIRKGADTSLSGRKGAWLTWLMGCRTERQMHPIGSRFTHFTLRHSQSSSASQSNRDTKKPPAASPYQAVASDCRREGREPQFTYTAEDLETRWNPHLKWLPWGAQRPEAGWCCAHTCFWAPGVQPPLLSHEPLHPDVWADTSLTMAWETGDRAAQGKAHLGSYCFTDIGRPTKTPRTSSILQGTDSARHLHQWRLLLSASNRRWGGGLEFTWPSSRRLKIQVLQLSSLHFQWRNACVSRDSWTGSLGGETLASSFQVPVGMSLCVWMYSFQNTTQNA